MQTAPHRHERARGSRWTAPLPMRVAAAGRLLLVMLAVLGGLGGCAAQADLPHARLGALPFPGAFTLYTPCEVSELGAHRYTSWETRPFERGEGARGIVYTRRAGFLDMAHIRESADWTRHLWKHSRPLLEKDGGSFHFTREDTGFEVVITLPCWWKDVSGEERALLIDSVSLRLAQRGAYEIQTWHEIATWFGWRTVPLVSEQGSSFTWEDTTSHLVGVLIAGRVLISGDDHYDDRTGEAIKEMLTELDAVPLRAVDLAARSVEGRWWKNGTAIRRDLDLAMDDSVKVPWLVPPADGEEPVLPAVLEVPSLRGINGRDLTGMFQLRITPPSSVRRGIYPKGAESGEPGGEIIPERDFPGIMAKIRAQMAERWGDDVDRP